MIADIIALHRNITVIHQENLSLSVARNNGIAAAKGEYILMPDSDDLLIENSLKPLLDKALDTQADLVVADFLKMTDEQIDHLQSIPQKDFSVQDKTGEELFLEDLNPHECFVWRTLYRREFILENELKFVPGIYCQDVPFTHEAYIKAKRCIRTPWQLYIYRIGRPGAASISFSKKRASDYPIIIAKTWELTKLKDLTPNVLQKLKDDVYISFSVFVHDIYFGIKDNQFRTYILKEFRKAAPDLFFSNGIGQWLHSISFRFFPDLYFHFVNLNILLRKKLHR
jgi:glycosyltransferase involved in cell wall biosynthesis